MLHPISAVIPITIPYHVAVNGELIVMEGQNHVPFTITRVFVVQGLSGVIRGQHAHKACTQFMICPLGSVEVHCDDGCKTATHILDQPHIGLLVPPSIWAQQTYLAPHSVLTVLCDRPYEPEDYIRNYDEFKNYRITEDDIELEKK